MPLSPRFRSILNRLIHPLGQSVVHQPLLNDIELQQLRRQAQTVENNPFLINTDVQHQLLGERTSSFSGGGYEFAEHRRYAAGDDPRFIDWRVMARTGKLYRKLFHEERRPQLYLLVDRRAPMRFGTRQQLKVTCAVRQAIQLLYQAQQQQLLTGCLLLEDRAHWLKASQSPAESHNIVQQLNRACPPLAFHTRTVALGTVLNELAVRLSPGCIIYLISDFHDLDSQTSSSLYQLAQQHQLNAIQVLDPVELALPQENALPIYDDTSRGLLNIDTSDAELRKQFHAAMQARQQEVQSLIEGTGGHYSLRLTGDELYGE